MQSAGTSLLGYLGTCLELVLSTRRGATFQSNVSAYQETS